jgi:D-3-phosphoglycerate dehydrogenase / 2-oxoglutarate reductase
MKILFADYCGTRLPEILKEKGHSCAFLYEAGEIEILEAAAGHDGLVIRSKFKIGAETVSRLKNLKFIARFGAGMENIDVEAAEKAGIICLSAPEGNRQAVAEHALGMLLSLFRNIPRANREVREGIWQREKNRGEELSGKTVGIIGFGNMGSAFAEILRGFNPQVLVYDKYKSGFGNSFIRECSLTEIFENADIISLHVPLTEETKHLAGEKFFNSFRKPVWVINTSRGPCLSNDALLNALHNGKVKGACLDVLEGESVSFEEMGGSGKDKVLEALLKKENVIFSPHIAGWSFQSLEKMSEILAKKIEEIKS